MQVGYESQRPFTDAEVRFLPLLVSARCAVSLTNGAAVAARDSSCDRAYVLGTQRYGWRALGALEKARQVEGADGRTWLLQGVEPASQR